MSDFEEYMRQLEIGRDKARRDGQSAAMLNDPGVQPEVGKCYTVSPDFVCGDRSHCERVLRVEKSNGHTVQCVVVYGRNWSDGKPHLLVINERYWYPWNLELSDTGDKG